MGADDDEDPGVLGGVPMCKNEKEERGRKKWLVALFFFICFSVSANNLYSTLRYLTTGDR